MSCTPQETRILDLWDGGLSIKQIAAETGIRSKTVENTVSYFHGRHEQRVQEGLIRKGSMDLLAAIRQVRA
jgi:DNA-directed RNA polymerase specialized sigma24 family protein